VIAVSKKEGTNLEEIEERRGQRMWEDNREVKKSISSNAKTMGS
jgi:hypothetical protein